MMNFREICKTIFFCIVSINLGVSSGLEILGFVFAALFIAIHIKQFVLSKSAMNQRKSRATEKFLHTVRLSRVRCGGC